IDCPPSSGLLVINALFATEEILIPMTGDYLAMQGLSHLMATLANFEEALQKTYTQWIVLSRFHDRRRLAQEVREKLIDYFPDTVLKTSISEAASLAECPGFGKTVFEYRPNSKSTEEYTKLVKDLISGRVF
ncbi:MAG: ParA family protein, partial [Gammaproteobacteria bacterium]|nr:ParA family protein [Gammaproteobacteria bacterium]